VGPGWAYPPPHLGGGGGALVGWGRGLGVPSSRPGGGGLTGGGAGAGAKAGPFPSRARGDVHWVGPGHVGNGDGNGHFQQEGVGRPGRGGWACPGLCVLGGGPGRGRRAGGRKGWAEAGWGRAGGTSFPGGAQRRHHTSWGRRAGAGQLPLQGWCGERGAQGEKGELRGGRAAAWRCTGHCHGGMKDVADTPGMMTQPVAQEVPLRAPYVAAGTPPRLRR